MLLPDLVLLAFDELVLLRVPEDFGTDLRAILLPEDVALLDLVVEEDITFAGVFLAALFEDAIFDLLFLELLLFLDLSVEEAALDATSPASSALTLSLPTARLVNESSAAYSSSSVC